MIKKHTNIEKNKKKTEKQRGEKKNFRRDFKKNIGVKTSETTSVSKAETNATSIGAGLDDYDEEFVAEELSGEFSTGFDFHKKYTNLPLVVIAGRPNVGKSTLFNRFLHRRCSITDPTPGVTRDPVEKDAFLLGYPVKLMDTGGFKLEREVGTSEAYLDELVVQKTLEALKKSNLILLLLEASNPTSEDEEFIKLLRPYWDKVIAAVNKTEGGRGESDAWNYLSFGFKDVVFISAEHGDNITELAKKITGGLDFSEVKEAEEQTFINVALVGKPNTGKSTLTNRLTHSELSIVSDIAGTTRDVVEGDFSYRKVKFHILDTAGIRRKARVNENIEYYSVNRAIKTMGRADVVFHMIDAQEGLSEQDKKIIALAHDKGKAIIFCLNKWDLEAQDKKTLKKAQDNIRIMFGQMNFAPIVNLSALEGTGIKDLLNLAINLYGQLNRKVETGPLNKALAAWLEAYPPPSKFTTRFKIRYMVQVSTNPVKFLVFVSKPDVIQENYVSYLKNCIRRDLGFENIPIQLEIKASRQKWEERTSR